MAKLSEAVFHASSLNRWGSDGYTPPKPPSARAISHLAALLDQAEHAESAAWDEPISCEAYGCLSDRRHSAEARYVRAINQRDAAARFKAQNRKSPVRASDAFALKDQMYEARTLNDRLENLGENFSTLRERIDAQAAAHHAADLYDIAQTKFYDAERFERRTGIRKRPRSRVRLVTDGYVTTGKYKMIDGARVPVLEKVT